jgi:hypothetical protein
MKFSYIISGLTHVNVVYTDASLVAGVYTMFDRLAGFTLDPQNGADGWAGSFSALNPATGGPTSALWELQELVGVSWITRVSGSTSLTTVSSTTYFAAAQMTVTLRAISANKLKVVQLENIAIPPYHYIAAGSLPSPFASWYAKWTMSGSSPYGPWRWALSRGGDALMDDPLVAITGDLNDSVRRARGLV